MKWAHWLIMSQLWLVLSKLSVSPSTKLVYDRLWLVFSGVAFLLVGITIVGYANRGLEKLGKVRSNGNE